MYYLSAFLVLCCLFAFTEEAEPVGHPNTKTEAIGAQRGENGTERAAPEEGVEERPPPFDMQKRTESYETAFIKTVVVLIALLLLIFLTVWMFKRLSRGHFGTFGCLKSIKILEKRPLSPKSMLYLIKIENQRILISESQFEIRNISHLTPDSNTSKDL